MTPAVEDAISEARRLVQSTQTSLGPLRLALTDFVGRLETRADEVEAALDVLDDVTRDLNRGEGLGPGDLASLAARLEEAAALLDPDPNASEAL